MADRSKSKKLMLGSDYDGTFRRRKDTPEPEDIEAVKEFRRRGNIFGIVTGRTPAEMGWILEQFGDMCDFLLCATGGLALFPDGTMEDFGSMSAEDIPELRRICAAHNCNHTHSDAMTLTGGITTMEELSERFPAKEGDEYLINGYVDRVVHCATVSADAIPYIGTITQFTSYFGRNEDCIAAIEEINAVFPGKYKCHYLGVGFDMTRAESNKTDGIARVAKHFGIDRDCIYTAGDGWNDVDMLKAYHGIAMSGTGQGIMDAAEWVYDTVGDAVHDLLLKD